MISFPSITSLPVFPGTKRPYKLLCPSGAVLSFCVNSLPLSVILEIVSSPTLAVPTTTPTRQSPSSVEANLQSFTVQFSTVE